MTMGMTRRNRVVLVIAATDVSGNIRIISARRATKRERDTYRG